MARLIYAEVLKGHRSFGHRSLIIFPSLVTMLAILLMLGQQSQIGAYNWWYTLCLPATVAFFTMQLTNVDKQLKDYNLKVLPIAAKKIWLIKILTGCLYLILANCISFGFSTLAGIIFGSQYPAGRGILAAFVLTITWLWQVPLGIFLVAKFNGTISFLILITVNIIFISQDFAGGSWWWIPFAIPARLMAPIVGINPNGVPLAENSFLWDRTVIIPGMLITLVLFFIITFLTTKWFVGRNQND